MTALLPDSPFPAAHLSPDAGPSDDLSKAQILYVNFCRVTGTPEELILDFALQTEPGAGPEHSLRAPQRIALSLYTAKRLFQAMYLTVQSFESIFGPVEPDIEKRLVPPRPQ